MRLLAPSAAAVLAVLAAVPSTATACRFYVEPKTWRQEFEQADLVLYGVLTNPRLQKEGEAGATDFHVTEVLKDDPARAGMRLIRLDRYVAPDKTGMNPPRYIVFFAKSGRQLEPTKGIKADSVESLDYLKGLIAVKGKDRTSQLAYFVSHLDHRDREISEDSARELLQARGSDLRNATKHFQPQRLRNIVQNPESTSYQLQLGARLLALCGTEADAKLLRLRLVAGDKAAESARDSLLFGEALLLTRHGEKSAGPAMLKRELADRGTPFIRRYAAIRALRYAHEEMSHAFSLKDVVGALCAGLDDPENADFVIEELRKLKEWDRTDQVLGIFKNPTLSAPVIQRSVLRFALQCPNPAAVAFVRQQRARDPDFVTDTEELLRLEAPAPPAAGKNGK